MRNLLPWLETMATPLKTHYTYTYCRAIGSGFVTTGLNDFGLSRSRFEHPTYGIRGEYSDFAAAATFSPVHTIRVKDVIWDFVCFRACHICL